jgi:SAM-dependent methyltransferase
VTTMERAALPPLICPDCLTLLERTDRAELHCEKCDHVYVKQDGVDQLLGSKSEINLSELMIQDEVSDLYETVRYTVETSKKYHHRGLVDIINFAPPQGDVLEIGCGSGTFLALLCDGEDTRTLSAIDLSPGMLKYANARLTAVDPPLPWRISRADAERLPFEDSSFDYVVARGLLHHLPNPRIGAQEIARVLRPGGTAVIVDPNRNIISTLPRFLARGTSHFDSDHKNFSLREIKSIIDGLLRVESLKFWGYLAYPLLGFPDVLRLKWLPLKRMYRLLVGFDDAVSKVPFVKRLGWGIILKVTHPNGEEVIVES